MSHYITLGRDTNVVEQNILHRVKMTALNLSYKDRHFLAVIGDEVQTLSPTPWLKLTLQSSPWCRTPWPVCCWLESGYDLACLKESTFHLISLEQHVTQPPDSQKNFFVVDAKTEVSTIEQAFDRYTHDRKDIAILLINQHVRATNIKILQGYC